MQNENEVRVRDPRTGGEKGSKPERQDLIPPEPIRELALVYGFGANKYAPDNYRKGYSWRLSIGALLRHFHAWNRGERTDPETGLQHLAHVMWHCICLMEFERLGLGTDDRYSTIDSVPVSEALEPIHGGREAIEVEIAGPPKRIYIAGPMRGYENYNFEIFDVAKAGLEADGWTVVSPADLDREKGFDPASLPEDHDWSAIPPGFDFEDCRKRDIAAIEACTHMFMLPGWANSVGARAERAYAEWKGIPVMGATK